MRKPAPSDPFAESQTFSDRGRGAQGERGNGRCGIGRRARRKHAATEDIEITEVVGTAILVDDGLLWICSHDGSSHDMAGAAIDQIRACIPLQYHLIVDSHGLENVLVELDDGVERLADIMPLVIDLVLNSGQLESEFEQIRISCLIRFGDAVFFDWKLLAGAVERDLPHSVIEYLIAELRPELTAVGDEVE